MEETAKIICITCPMGCALDVTHEGTVVSQVTGNSCKRGAEYAQNELTDPRRMVTTTVRLHGGRHPLLPVYTAAPLPRHLIFDLLAELRKVELQAPVEAGQVILRNALGTGIDVLASTDSGAAEAHRDG
jgi:CxxC motif-containing protein